MSKIPRAKFITGGKIGQIPYLTGESPREQRYASSAPRHTARGAGAMIFVDSLELEED